MKICFKTYGCRLNRAEALKEEAIYIAAGHQRSKGHADADMFIIRGCSVTARAQRNCEKLVNHLKRKYPGKPIAVTGCLKIEGMPTPPPIAKPFKAAVPVRTARAYLKVQDGCDCKCAFCIVPSFRGASRVVPFDEVMDEAKRFLDAGYHELVVTGCNLAMYRFGNKGLPELLSALAELSLDARVRLGSVEPGLCAREVVKTMAEHKNICRFLHLPIQSGSDLILKAMHRPYRAKDIDALLNYTSRTMPRLGLGCDIMTGFPCETEKDFVATEAMLIRYPFSNVHVFPFSERPGTEAAKMIGSIPPPVRHSRADVIADLAAQKRELFARRFFGHTVKVLIEDEEKHRGWTGEYLPCEVLRRSNGKPLRRKEIVSARVIDFVDGRLLAAQNSCASQTRLSMM